MYVLRKTFGSYSAGTPVDVDTGTILGEHQMTRFTIGSLDVPTDLVVQRRERSSMVPTLNSRERRRRTKAAKKALGF